jgi:hypothetical protein
MRSSSCAASSIKSSDTLEKPRIVLSGPGRPTIRHQFFVRFLADRPSPLSSDPGFSGWRLRVAGVAVASETPRCQRSLFCRSRAGDRRTGGIEPASGDDRGYPVHYQHRLRRFGTSTVTTGNLRTLAEAAVGWLHQGRRQAAAQVVRDFSVICAAFPAGATAGASSVQTFGNRALWCDVIVLVLVAICVRSRIASPAIVPDTAASVEDRVEESPVPEKGAALGS